MTATVVRQVVGYGVAVLTSGAALLVWQTLTRHVGPGVPPFPTLYLAVMLTATLYGLGPGLLATLLAAFLAACFVFPLEGLAVGSPLALLGLGSFFVMGVGMSLVAERYHRARHRATTYAQALQASEQRYRSLVELAPDAVLVHQAGRIVYANGAAFRLYGAATAAQLVGTDMLDLVHPEDRALVSTRIRKCMEGQMVPPRALRHRRLDGQDVSVETMAAPIDWHGVGAVQTIVRNVTARRRVADRLWELNVTAAQRVRVLVVDDHTIVRQALAMMLGQEPDVEIAGEAANGQEAVTLVSQVQPDLVLMDVTMPVMNGIEATRAIHAAHPEVCVIGLSMYDRDEQAEAMRDAGAMDYVPKSAPPDELLTVLRGWHTRRREELPPAAAAPAKK